MKLPKPPTLRKYGLTEQDWMDRWLLQGEKCPICQRSDAPLVIDHEHVRGWKKMPPEKRKLYVRGITCNWCNRWIIGRGAKPHLLLNGADYLLDYEERKPK